MLIYFDYSQDNIKILKRDTLIASLKNLTPDLAQELGKNSEMFCQIYFCYL